MFDRFFKFGLSNLKKLKVYTCLLIVLAIGASCQNVKNENRLDDTENTNDSLKMSGQETLHKDPTIDKGEIINSLQGEWREIEYPFRLAIFQESSLKLVEEGIAEEPRFKKYEISDSCPFDVNNIKEVTKDEWILVMVEDETCEKLSITTDTLIFRGFSVHTNAEYEIVYQKVKKE